MPTTPDMRTVPATGLAAGGSLLGWTRPQIEALSQDLGLPAYRASQIFRWLHAAGARSFAAMTDLPADLRTLLASRFTLHEPRARTSRKSSDGTTRWVLELDDGALVEAVYLPDGERTTFCLSSQVGCRFGCTFCATATMGLVRQLSTAEIIGQVTSLARAHELPRGAPFNVVFMGMGEPMDNLGAVLDAFDVLTDADGFGLSWKRVTISTVGHVDGISRLGQRSHRPRLAVSLNASRDEVRSAIMPVNRRWPLAALRRAVAAFPVRSGERVTFEYVLLAGDNDTPDDARSLAALAAGLPVHINIIPWNEHPGLGHARPADAAVEAFRDRLLSLGADASVRRSRGRDVAAACGQLVTPPPHLSRRTAT